MIRKPRPFKFLNFFLDNKNFLGIVADFWRNTYVPGTSMFIISKKLKLLKGIIQKFHRDNYSCIEKRVSDAAVVLAEWQQNFLTNPSASLLS